MLSQGKTSGGVGHRWQNGGLESWADVPSLTPVSAASAVKQGSSSLAMAMCEPALNGDLLQSPAWLQVFWLVCGCYWSTLMHSRSQNVCAVHHQAECRKQGCKPSHGHGWQSKEALPGSLVAGELYGVMTNNKANAIIGLLCLDST